MNMPASKFYEIDIIAEEDAWNNAIKNVTIIVENAIKAVLENQNLLAKIQEVSVVLTNDDMIKSLNQNYRGKEKATNVLSFPQTIREELDNEEYIILGDIVVAFETVKKEAAEQNKKLSDHLIHMLVHGCLHLLHYDHISDKDAEVMENLEIKILNQLGLKNPYVNT